MMTQTHIRTRTSISRPAFLDSSFAPSKKVMAKDTSLLTSLDPTTCTDTGCEKNDHAQKNEKGYINTSTEPKRRE
jgi:hypothetical protein